MNLYDKESLYFDFPKIHGKNSPNCNFKEVQVTQMKNISGFELVQRIFKLSVWQVSYVLFPTISQWCFIKIMFCQLGIKPPKTPDFQLKIVRYLFVLPSFLLNFPQVSQHLSAVYLDTSKAHYHNWDQQKLPKAYSN